MAYALTNKPNRLMGFLLMVLVQSPLGGSEYFVDRNHPSAGDGNPGTESLPWLTVQKAAKITFKALPRRSVQVLHGFNINADAVRVEGFDVTHDAGGWLGGGIWLSGHDAEIVDNYIHHVPGGGITANWSANRGLWKNVYVGHNHIYGCNKGISSVSGDNWLVEKNDIERLIYSGGDADYMRFFGTHNVIRGNYLHGTLLEEIGPSHTDFFQPYDNNGETARDIVFEYNVCTGFAHQAFMMSSSGSHQNKRKQLEKIPGKYASLLLVGNWIIKIRKELTMGRITTAHAWANNEVAYVAWDIDGKIEGCLGFEVTRVYLKDDGSVERRPDGSEDRVNCAAWVAFKGQHNPLWLPQDTGVWPVQKLSWRDLTLRKKRDGMERRPDEVLVRYEIRPVGDTGPGLPPVPSNGLELQYVLRRDQKGKPMLGSDGKRLWNRVKAYEGKPRPLAYLAPVVVTNDIRVTSRHGCFSSVFTNGILAAQWLRNVLNEDGVIEKNELIDKISNPDDPHRKYLAGDVIPLIRRLFGRDGEFYLALYELEDRELEEILEANVNRIHVVLSNTGKDSKGGWDARNAAARKRLTDAGVDIQHRMFNNSIHIGHNKFVVHAPPGNGPRSVLTGSTNWTSTGLAGQTNNALLVEDDAVAGAFLDYWRRMKADTLKLPKPLGKEMKDNQQSQAFRKSNETPSRFSLAGGASVEAWFSPNMAERQKRDTKTKKAATPPDLSEVYRRMRKAEEAILFLAFYPGQRGKDCIIGEAIEIGRNDRSLLVAGAVSSSQAMPNYVPKKKGEDDGVIEEGESPATYEDGNVTIVRASRIDDLGVLGDIGAEQLTAKGGIGAIIHDKLVVIDPRLPTCTVVLGSHNLGFKASYSNDENLLIVTGDRELAAAYAVHILDVYDHYRFRAVEAELKRKGKKGWSGFLDTDDGWQNGYVDGRKGALMRYFAR